jgi:glycosyltransferase involved in cell wall biosynthesis
MKVSIITAVYNGAQTIAATLDSVARQDHADIEHIVIDGASSDATLEIIRAHRPAVARVISEPDTGVYDAFNKGLRAASGEAIAYLNCGDTYSSSASVSTMVSELSRGETQAVFGDVWIVDAMDSSRIVRRYSSRRFTPQRMRWGIMPAHPTLLLRRGVYQAAGEYDPQFKIAGDYEYCLRVFVLRATPYRYISEALVRMPAGGLSNRGWRSKLQITREMRSACAKHAVPTNFAMLSLRFPLKMLELV